MDWLLVNQLDFAEGSGCSKVLLQETSAGFPPRAAIQSPTVDGSNAWHMADIKS